MAFMNRLLPELLGHFANYENLRNSTILLVHADNYCDCNFDDFIRFHYTKRPKNCPITMMVFNTQTPETCGIVETDENNLVQKFYEKVNDPPETWQMELCIFWNQRFLNGYVTTRKSPTLAPR